jgi:hypothetical protein
MRYTWEVAFTMIARRHFDAYVAFFLGVLENYGSWGLL